MNSLEKIWARATGHLMGNTDDDRPDVPVLTLREARIALCLKNLLDFNTRNYVFLYYSKYFEAVVIC